MAIATNTQSCLFVRVADWIKAEAERKNEFASVMRLDVSQMARELGIGEADLREVLPHGPEHGGTLGLVMAARGLDAEQVAQSQPAMMRRLVRNCTRCRSTGRCRYALAQGAAAHEYSAYCANSEAFEMLAPH